MPSYKRVPSPSGDSGVWGTILNAHLAQTKNPANGAFNSFDTFATRPAASGFTQDDVGRSYLFTQTGNWHELAWNGTALYWKIQNHDKPTVC